MASPLLSIFLLFYVYWTEIEVCLSHSCSHSVPKRHEVIHNVHLEPAHVMRRRSVDQPLRIHLVYDPSVSALSTSKQSLVKNELIPSAVSFWEETLMVRHTAGPIRLLRQCRSELVRYLEGDAYPYCVDGCAETTVCGDTTVPEEHLEACREGLTGDNLRVIGKPGAGVVESDFILYVSSLKSGRCQVGTTVAYAAYCQLESALDRPVAGYVNLCPDAISTKAHDIHQMLSTIKHEILHSLGFSAGLYAFFRDKNGDPLTPRFKTGKPPFNEMTQLHQWSDKVVKTINRTDWRVHSGTINKTVHLVVTPRVREEVRAHYNCPTLEGAELEDQGVVGTAFTHWEKRMFENEVMTGTYTQNPMISRITLALMEDTGWYGVNYDNAEELKWGKNLGCDFVQKSCMDWMESRRDNGEHIHPYCDRVKTEKLQTECTENRDAVALCNLVEYTADLSQNYQHFKTIVGVPEADVTRYAGSVALADYCPYIQEFNWKKGEAIVRGSRCGVAENNADPEVNYAVETYGNTSRCFDHNQPWKLHHCTVSHQVEHWGSGCYKFSCQPATGLSVIVANVEYRCYRAGQLIKVQVVSEDWLHDGAIICPPCTEICEPAMICPPDINPPQRSEEVIAAPCTASLITVDTITLTTILVTITTIFRH